MSDNNEIKNTIQPWIVSLGISIFCCALFFAFMSSYVGAINKSLAQINDRLASMEARAVATTSAPAPAAPTVVTPAPVAPASTVDAPSGVTGSAAPSATPTAVPAAAPIPPIPGWPNAIGAPSGSYFTCITIRSTCCGTNPCGCSRPTIIT